MKKLYAILLAILIGFLVGIIIDNIFFKSKPVQKNKTYLSVTNDAQPKKVIAIMPFGYVNIEYIKHIQTTIKEFYGYETKVLPAVKPTNDMLTPSKIGYDADKFPRKYPYPGYILIITKKNISHKDENKPELCFFGSAIVNGYSAVVSTYQLDDYASNDLFMNRLDKIVLHELGHNFGLRHCQNDYHCLMTNTEGTLEELDREDMKLCDICKSKIRK